MMKHVAIQDQLHRLIRAGAIKFGGNARLKIYGLLSCRSGKKMKMGNRVFFRDEAAALAHGFRPCGHCMKKAYREWKQAMLQENAAAVQDSVRQK